MQRCDNCNTTNTPSDTIAIVDENHAILFLCSWPCVEQFAGKRQQ